MGYKKRSYHSNGGYTKGYTVGNVLDVILAVFNVDDDGLYRVLHAMAVYTNQNAIQSITQSTKTRFTVRGILSALGLCPENGAGDRCDVIFVEFDSHRTQSLYNKLSRHFPDENFTFVEYQGSVIAYINKS